MNESSDINSDSSLCGRLPDGQDRFETGYYQNFSPLYYGELDEWIRPKVSITDENPIEGTYSLRWTSSEKEQQWVLVSNTFYLETPVTVSAKARIDVPPTADYELGLGIAESRDVAAAVTLTDDGIQLKTSSWNSEEGTTVDSAVIRETVYDLSLTIQEDGKLYAAVTEESTGETVATLDDRTTVEPNSIALYVRLPPNTDKGLYFDDIRISSGSYCIRSDEWVRSPNFVVVPRPPDVDLGQGNWVGAASVFNDEEQYRMWYRIRSNQERGEGYGYATSCDGLEWEKSDDNPVLPMDEYSSNERMSVLHVDSTYEGWYTVDTDETWAVGYATSPDGVDWTKHGIVIEGYAKDPVVTYVDDTYYLYAISPTSTEFGVYTSESGIEWTRQNTIDLGGLHCHPGAYYNEENSEFWLYAFAEERDDPKESRVASVDRASSTDGIEFGPLESTWTDPPTGIDHRPPGGIDYGAFLTDERGHVPDDRRLLMYYQARHNYENNRPSWQWAGDGRVVLAGRFTGLFKGVPTTVEKSDDYTYETFPINCEPVRGLEAQANDSVTVLVEKWNTDGLVGGKGTVTSQYESQITFTVSEVSSNTYYRLAINGEQVDTAKTRTGVVTLSGPIPANHATFSINSPADRGR
jgi:hypothetical protein